MHLGSFPQTRLRRLRRTPALRRMMQETMLTVNDLIYPLFVVHGKGVRREVPSMPGVYQLSVDEAVREAEEAAALGIPAVILFGIPAHKDPIGTENFDPEGIIPKAIQAIKQAVPDLVVITDVCMCEYTDHGHCGIVREGEVVNDETLEIYGKVAVTHAQAGADMVAPSGMMDGQVAAIRRALDEAGYAHIPIMAYAAKYASHFYGPFRDAAQSPPQFGDRRGYQMNPANAREALREVALDIAEGADIVMVKPALAYLDVIRAVREAFPVPVAAYNVSGEYAMVKATAQRGWLDERAVTLEILTAIKRAGADLILTYHAKEVAQWLHNAR